MGHTCRKIIMVLARSNLNKTYVYNVVVSILLLIMGFLISILSPEILSPWFFFVFLITLSLRSLGYKLKTGQFTKQIPYLIDCHSVICSSIT